MSISKLSLSAFLLFLLASISSAIAQEETEQKNEAELTVVKSGNIYEETANNPWDVVSEEPITKKSKIDSKELSYILNNGGGLGNLIFLAIFFIFGTVVSYILKILFFKTGPAKKVTIICLVSLSSLVLLTLLIVNGKVNPNIAGMLTVGYFYGAWRGLNKHKSSIENKISKPKTATATIEIFKKFSNSLNLKQRLAISIFLPFFLYFVWKGISGFLFENYDSENIFSGPWWFLSVYFLCLIFLEIMILNDQKK